MVTRCRRCSRVLKNKKAVEKGVGSHCAKKEKEESARNTTLVEFGMAFMEVVIDERKIK